MSVEERRFLARVATRKKNGYDLFKQCKKSRSVEVGGHLGNIYLLEEGAPRYELRIDREGRWFHEGVEIVRDDIRAFFSRNLVCSEDGSYCVRIGDDEALVVVEDAPLVVLRVGGTCQRGLTLLLSDGTEELLDARTLLFKFSNIPYCRVRKDIEARFSRPAYYQLAEFITYDESSDKYFLNMADGTVELESC